MYCFVDQNKIQGEAKLPQKQRNCAKQSAIQATSCLADFSIQVLFPQILTRREPRHLLEEAGEMMGKVEAQEARGFADVVAIHEQALGLVDDIVVDVADGRSTCGLVDNISEITRRIGQL